MNDLLFVDDIIGVTSTSALPPSGPALQPPPPSQMPSIFLTIVTGEYIFQLGDRFASYEELQNRLDAHSQANFVHYWRRDTRTVEGAIMKTARPIAKCLKYYSVRYACVHGGQKYASRGKGRRQTQSMRFDCPAFIMLRASKCGQYLEVIGVCNEHNHEISETSIRLLPQNRKLSPEIRAEVIDMLIMHIERKKIIEYVKEKTGKQITTKDLFNLKTVHLKQNLIGRDSVKKKYFQTDTSTTAAAPFADDDNDILKILPNKINQESISIDNNNLTIVPHELFESAKYNDEELIEQNQQLHQQNELIDTNEIEINYKYDDFIIKEGDCDEEVAINESTIIEYDDFIIENTIEETINHNENNITLIKSISDNDNLILPASTIINESSMVLESKPKIVQTKILNKKNVNINKRKLLWANKRKHCKYCGINIKLAKKQLELLEAEKQKLIEETQILRLTKQRLLLSNEGTLI